MSGCWGILTPFGYICVLTPFGYIVCLTPFGYKGQFEARSFVDAKEGK